MASIQEVLSILKSKGKYWIAFTGDSITSCEWVHPNWREIVEYVLKEELTKALGGDWKLSEWGIRCFNFGYDGSTTKDILEKTDDIKKIDPDMTILMIGGNDPSLEVSLNEHKSNIEKIRNTFQNSKTRFIFSTDNKPWNKKAEERYAPYVEIDKTILDLNFINLFEASDNFPKGKIYTFKSEENPVENIKEGDLDYWHPNQLGNAYIANVILKKVFGIDFNPEIYWIDTVKGEKHPNY